VFRGISTLMFFRLCCRAPRITSLVRPMSVRCSPRWKARRLRSQRKRPLREELPAAGTTCLRMQALELSSYTEPTITLHDNSRERKRSRIRSARPFASNRQLNGSGKFTGWLPSQQILRVGQVDGAVSSINLGIKAAVVTPSLQCSIAEAGSAFRPRGVR
jgi:hypothetical protein